MKSRITLYFKSLITPEKNFVLDDNGRNGIELYLNSLTKYVRNEFQYIKNQVSLSIKVDFNQDKLETIDSNDINYVKIENYDVVNEEEVYERPIYYFVINKIWRANNTIEFVLAMDTLNSYRFNVDYKLTNKTIIKRMHKDRFDISISAFFISKDEIPLWLPPFSNAEFNVENMLITGYEDKNILNVKGIYRDGDDVPPLARGLYLYGFNKEDSKWIWEHRNSNRYNLDSITYFGDAHELDNPQPLSDININATFIKKIDLKSEEISTPLYKENEIELLEDVRRDIKWSLYYKNSSNQENSPIDCYLTPNNEINIQDPQDTILVASMIPNGKYLVVCRSYNENYLIFDFGTIKIAPLEDVKHMLVFKNDNGRLVAWYLPYEGLDHSWHLVSDDVQSCSIINSNGILNGRIEDGLPNISDILYFKTYEPQWVNTNIDLNTPVVRTIKGKDTIDKTLQENLKIINIPYCVTNYDYVEVDNEEIILFTDYWQYEASTERLKLTNFNQKFINNIESNADDILNEYETSLSLNTSAERYVIDSKLFHSDFYQIKFVYDSFNYSFYLEQINYFESIKTHNTRKFTFQFIMSRNIVSKFLFKFDYVYKHPTQDYPNVVAVARNNEEVLYNSSYLNYVRTGYNYDLKAKEKQDVVGGVGIGLSVAGILASIGLSLIPGGQAIGVAGVVGSAIGLANQITNYAKSTSQNEENLQRKLQESQRQAVSVMNADDYDLMEAYNNNKAKLCYYKVSPNMEKILDDLFYYCGYLCNEQGIPNVSSRYWFNFVQAGLIIKETSNLSSGIEDDIKEKFEQGVTFLHYHNTFDFNQEKENWETSLL